MRQLPVGQNHFALVDDEDFPRLSQFHWMYRAERDGNQGYAVRNVKVDGRRRHQYLHRDLMEPPPGHEVIFLNGDRLDCQRSNLRVVTVAEARRHHRRRRDSASKYKGVAWHRDIDKWVACIRADGRAHHLGTFDTEEQAARAYDAAARKHHGDIAMLNFPGPDPASPRGSPGPTPIDPGAASPARAA